PVLGADDRELARHEGQRRGDALVAHCGVGRPVRELVAGAGEPAAAELPVRADVETLGLLIAIRLLALAPEVLAAHDEGAVRPALERLPAVHERRVLKARGVGRT